MRAEDLVDGMRVCIVQTIDIFPLGIFPEGVIGTVFLIPTSFVGYPEGMIGTVKLDDHFPALDEWDNCLHLFNSEEEQCTPDYFEPAIGFV